MAKHAGFMTNSYEGGLVDDLVFRFHLQFKRNAIR